MVSAMIRIFGCFFVGPQELREAFDDQRDVFWHSNQQGFCRCGSDAGGKQRWGINDDDDIDDVDDGD